MSHTFYKASPKNPLGKSDANYTTMKTAVHGLVNAAADDLPFDAIIAQLQATPPAGWTADEITEGLIKQVAQDLNLPHI